MHEQRRLYVSLLCPPYLGQLRELTPIKSARSESYGGRREPSPEERDYFWGRLKSSFFAICRKKTTLNAGGGVL